MSFIQQEISQDRWIPIPDESISPARSHKPNTAVAQAYYNKIERIKRLTTETGAGQWGSALAFACKAAHAIKAVIDEAIKCKETKEEKCIVFNFSGHGHFDINAYDQYLENKLEDIEFSEEIIEKALEEVKKLLGNV